MEIMVLIDPVLLLMLISFPPSLLILSFFFSSYIGTRAGNKNGLSKRGLLTSFAGLSIATALSLAAPIFPNAIPVMDVAVILTAATWVVLLRRYCGTGWLETLPQALVPVIAYVVILAIASAFTLLFTS
jgi:hypothetical protein